MTTDRANRISPDEFRRLRDWLHERVGIYFEDHKLPFLEKRILQRMADTQIPTAREYHFTLKFHDPGGRELQQLVNLITTNETYMFREHEQLQVFANHCLPEIMRQKSRSLHPRLRVWSAGCSSGEEPYTLAMILREVIEEHEQIPTEIIATDIDENMLRLTQQATYAARSVRLVPEEYAGRHLRHAADGFQVVPDTRRLVTTRHLNLNDATAMRSMPVDFDVIFCRNVLIYFADEARQLAVDRFYEHLNAGGYLFLTRTENVGRISNNFVAQRVAGESVYMKR